MRYFHFFIAFMLISFNLFSENSDTTEFVPKGEPIVSIFSNFNTSITDENNSSGFEIKRAYLGYKYQMSEEFSTCIKLDIGSPNDESQYSLLRRYAYFKTAELSYKKGNLTWNFGIINLHQFKFQEKFWAHRYIERSFQDKYKLGSSADIGSSVLYKLNKYVSVDFTIMNGEGYKSLQIDNTYKTGAGISLFPFKGFSARFYYDYSEKSVAQSTIASFIGYRFENLFSLGGGYNYQKNNELDIDHNLYGFSIFGIYNVNEKWQIFGRYDKLESNILSGEENPWNYTKNGEAIIGGVQFSPIKKIKISANYQSWLPEANDINNSQMVYINFEYKI